MINERMMKFNIETCKQKEKGWFKCNWYKIVVIGILLLIPLAIALYFSIHFLDGKISLIENIEKYKNNLILEPTDFPKLSETIYYMICTYTLIITGIFSYAIWQSGIMSNKLAEELKKREENKEFESIRENSLIVYYDLLLGIEDLKKLYVSKVINQQNPMPIKIFFSSDWIKNVAMLKNDLSRSEINDIYKLYGSLLTISSLLDEGQTAGKYSSVIDDEIKNLINKIYMPIFPKVFIKKYDESSIRLLNSKYYMLLEKLRFLTLKKEELKLDENKDKEKMAYINKCILFKGTFDETFNGNGLYYLEHGEVKYEGSFNNLYIYSGIVRDYYDNGNLMYEVKYKNGVITRQKLLYKDDRESYGGNLCFDCSIIDEEVNEGFVEQYFKSLNVKYRGYIKNGERNGHGESYYDYAYTKIRYSGTWIDNVFQDGQYYGNGERDIIKFNGQYKNGKPFNGDIEYGNLCFEKVFNAFKGELRNGVPYKGKGRVFFKDNMGRDYDAKLYETEAEELYDYGYSEEEQYDHKEIARSQKELEFEDTKSTYEQWNEYIDAEWKDGQVEIRDDDVLNKKIFYIEGTKIKK